MFPFLGEEKKKKEKREEGGRCVVGQSKVCRGAAELPFSQDVNHVFFTDSIPNFVPSDNLVPAGMRPAIVP